MKKMGGDMTIGDDDDDEGAGDELIIEAGSGNKLESKSTVKESLELPEDMGLKE